MPYPLGIIMLIAAAFVVIATIGDAVERSYNALTK